MAETKDAPPLFLNPSLLVEFNVTWQVPGGKRQSLTARPSEDSELYNFFCSCLAVGSSPDGPTVSDDLSIRLRQLGLLLSESASHVDQDLPASLSELPPLTSLRSWSRDEAVLNERCTLQTADCFPETTGRGVPAGQPLSGRRPLLWVEDPVTGALAVYSLSGELATLVPGLLRGEVTISALPTTVFEVLRAADVLVSPKERETRAAEWTRVCENARRALADDGAAVLRQLFNPVQVACCRLYLRSLEQAGVLFPDAQVAHAKRHSVYRDPVCEFLHAQSMAMISRIVPTVKPSYSFYGLYYPGASLERHTDRPQCEWNVSLVLDMAPDLPEAEAWPLFLEHNGRVHCVRLNVGDAVLYNGRRTPHWRDAQPDGHKTAAVFFHYVPADFVGSID